MGRERQRGQAGVETVGVAAALVLVTFAGWQAILAAHAWQSAQSAARSAARAGSVGAPVERAALTVLPDRLAERATVTIRSGPGPRRAVRVGVPVPSVLGVPMGEVEALAELSR